jgi:outer membrane protein W
MRIRIPVCLAVLLFAFSLCAQTNHLSVFLTDTRLDASTATFPDGVHKLSFDSRTGYGVAFDHFLSPRLAVHASAEKAHAHGWLEIFDQGVTLNSGTLDLTEYTAALHYYFNSPGPVRVFAGAGIARIQSADIHSAYAPLEVTFDAKTNWLVDGGVDISTGSKGALVLSARYTPYQTHYGAAPQNPLQVLKLNPVTLAAAFRWGF